VTRRDFLDLIDKAVDPDATICVILSETGLKTEAVPPALEANRLR
jgi:hypothetical protein